MKIIPRTRPDNVVDYTTLKPGDNFLYLGDIWVVVDTANQEAVNLRTGKCTYNMCGDIVVPVDATLTWKRITPKKKN